MSRYVEKKAFIALLNERIYSLCGGETVKETRNIRDMFEVFPAADVKPVVRGEWDEIERGGLLNKYVLFRCTHCGNIFKVYEDTLNAGRGDKNFCPHCGADMRTEVNDD